MTTTKITAGFYQINAEDRGYCCYQINAEDRGYGNIICKRDGKWHADIRTPEGELRRFAGIWNTYREAAEEVKYILARVYVAPQKP